MNTIICTGTRIGTSGDLHAMSHTLTDVDRSKIGDSIDYMLARGYDSFRVINHFQG